jgi:uncharacterized delta-60 repeat protein
MFRHHVSVGLLSLASFALFEQATAQGLGALDPTWGNGGIVVLPVARSGIMDIAVQADHKLVVATSKDTVISPLIRLLPDGSLDPDFGANGVAQPVQISNAPYRRSAWAVVLDDSARMLITGTATDSVWLARMLPNGEPDLSFGPNGYFAYSKQPSAQYLGTNITIDAQGRILLGASEYLFPEWQAALIRVLPTGVIDSTFGMAGRTDVPSPPGSGPVAYESCVLPSGSIFTVGSCRIGLDQRPFLGKMLADGTADLSFGTNGYILPQFSPFPSSRAYLTQCHLLAPDRLLLNTGGSGPVGESEVTVLMDTLGNYVESFGQNGRAWTDLENSSILLGPQHCPMEVGSPRGILDEPRIVNCNYHQDRIHVGRLFTNGETDTEFGNNGVATHEMAGDINVSCLALDGCRIYVAFRVLVGDTTQQAVVIALDGCGGKTTAVEGMNAQHILAPYPNPANDVVRVQLAFPHERVRIHDALGRSLSVPVSNVNGIMVLEVGSIPNGVYTLSTDQGRTSRLVVQH